MKCIVPFLGKTKEKYIAEGIADFSGRLERYVQLEIPILKEKKRTAKDDHVRALKEEAEALRQAVPSTAKVVALDLTGRQLRSEDFAMLLTKWEDMGIREVVFLIGSSDGLDPDIARGADFTLSLSKMTFTHEMARLLLLEQLYRAFSIKAGTGYHK